MGHWESMGQTNVIELWFMVLIGRGHLWNLSTNMRKILQIMTEVGCEFKQWIQVV